MTLFQARFRINALLSNSSSIVLALLITVLATMVPSMGGKAQTTILGTNNFIEYEIGTLPIVIGVPHGGDLSPARIPERTCGNPTTVTDANTIAVGRALRDSLFARTGCYPHIVYCHLDRPLLDVNRAIDDAACGNLEAELAYTEYHGFLDSARQLAADAYGEEVFFFDIHGHGHAIPRIEVGYLLNSAELRKSDSLLNTSDYIDESSIQTLVRTNKQGLTHSALLRGPEAFGSLLMDVGYPSVPSLEDPAPADGDPYFSGGYTTRVHTAATPGNTTIGMQLELNRPGIRDTDQNRRTFAGAFASAALQFINLHTELNLGGCELISSLENPNHEAFRQNLLCAPSLVTDLIDQVELFGLSNSAANTYELYDQTGMLVVRSQLNGAFFQLPLKLANGMYLVAVKDAVGNREGVARFVVLR